MKIPRGHVLSLLLLANVYHIFGEKKIGENRESEPWLAKREQFGENQYKLNLYKEEKSTCLENVWLLLVRALKCDSSLFLQLYSYRY